MEAVEGADGVLKTAPEGPDCDGRKHLSALGKQGNGREAGEERDRVDGRPDFGVLCTGEGGQHGFYGRREESLFSRRSSRSWIVSERRRSTPGSMAMAPR